MEYKNVLSKNDSSAKQALNQLDMEVNHYLKKGWQLYGNIHEVYSTSSWCFVQTLVKEEI